MTVGALVLGVLSGLITGLLAVGLVLVYKSNRFLNLAHAQLGALSAMLLAKFVLDWGWNWWAALSVGVVVGVATGVLVDRLVIRPLRAKTTSTVALMLVSIGVTQLLLALTYIPALGPNRNKLASRGYPVPLRTHLEIGHVVLGGQYVLTLVLVPVIVVALGTFLRYSTLGKMIRAAASNQDAARLCGISAVRVSTITWGIAGVLSAITAILQAPSSGSFSAGALGPPLLLLALGAAAFGAFVSIPLALVGGVVIGVAEQLTLAVTSSGGTARVVVFALILVVVLARGGAIAAAFAGDGGLVEDRPPSRIPHAVRSRPIVRYHRAWLALGSVTFAVLLPLLPYFRSEGRRFQLVLVLIYALLAVALTILVGWGGQVSLGHFAVVGAGAFLAARLAPHGISLPVLLVAAGIIGAVFLVVVGIPALRVRGLTLAVTTLGLSVVAPEWLFRQEWFGSAKPFGIPLPEPLTWGTGLGRPASHLSLYYASLVILGLVVLTARALRCSGPGRLIIAVRDNEAACAALGVTPATIKLATLAVSGFIAGMAGVLWAAAWRLVSTNQFAPDLSVALLALPVIGGLGSIGGAVAAAVSVYMPTYFLSPALSGLFGQFGRQVGFQLAVGGLGVVTTMLYYPTGIAGAAQRAWEKFLTGLAAAVERRQQTSPGETLVVGGVTLNFGGLRALNDASITVRPGEIVGLIGPNGAGKTTLMNVISGLQRPDTGSVRVHGREIVHLPASYRTSFGVGRSFQAARLFPGLTVTETVQVALSRQRRVGFISSSLGAPWARAAERATRARTANMVQRLGLTPWADTLTSDLSTGTRRICDLAAQAVAGPKLLLLDEPTAGVAQREAEAFGPLLRTLREELDCAILIVEHDMPLLMGLCDRVYAMEAGRVIAEGTPTDIRANPAVVASYLGTDETAIARSGDGITAQARPTAQGAARRGP